LVEKAVIYVRVSSDGQDVTNQSVVLEKWARALGLELLRNYQETASAWKAGHQVELKHLITDAYKRKFQVVLVWALDRLSREGPLRILSLVHHLKSLGIRVLSYQEAWTAAPGEIGDLLYSLVAWAAQMESKRRSERTKAGLARLVIQGKKLGRPTGSKDKRKRKRYSNKY